MMHLHHQGHPSHHQGHPSQQMNYQQQNPMNQNQQPPTHSSISQHPRDSGRMNHHHQQRTSHHQLNPQVLAPNRSNMHGSGNYGQHQPQIGHGMMMNHPAHLKQPPPTHIMQPPTQIMQKPRLHQNISTLNQKPHYSNQSASLQQFPPPNSQRLMQQDKPPIAIIKREPSATAVPTPIIVTSQPPPPITPTVSLLTKDTISSGLEVNNNSHHQKENISCNSNGILLSNDADGEGSDGLDALANTKEKTPMCLVNELARFNKIQHQYRLTGEIGPAHKKRFTVTLKMGDEEYTAEGLSIKKAQHAAATLAISKTVYNHPPLKTNRQTGRFLTKSSSSNITPTVELNALAMKRGEPTVYSVEPPIFNNINGPPPFNPSTHPPQPNQYNQQQPYNQRLPFNYYNNRNNAYPPQKGYGNNFRPPGPSGRFNGYGSKLYGGETYRVTLQVGTRSFTGMGGTQQLARHDAAARALEVLKPLANENTSGGPGSAHNKSTSSASSQHSDADSGDEGAHSELKSPISVVHEMALKRKLTVVFEVESERGPPHMKTYHTICRVGPFETEGEGNGKKLSKKKAAEKMMDELKKLPPLTTDEEPDPRVQSKKLRKPPVVVKKKTRNLIKEQPEGSGPDEVNAISQLIQIQQARKEKEPVYTVLDERGTARRREFTIEVTAGNGLSAKGTGSNKKLAKKIAAEKMLQLMGVLKLNTSTSPIKETAISSRQIRASSHETEKTKKVSFAEPKEVSKKATNSTPNSTAGGSSGRQIVPGMLLMSPSHSFVTPTKTTTKDTLSPPEISVSAANEPAGAEKVTASPSNSVTSNNDSGIGDGGVSPRDQLNYLAQLIGFQVSYSDFPKGNHGEFLTLVTLTTDPPHMSHGAGSNSEESRDQAAQKALNIISDVGLDNIKPKKISNVSPTPQSTENSDANKQ